MTMRKNHNASARRRWRIVLVLSGLGGCAGPPAAPVIPVALEIRSGIILAMRPVAAPSPAVVTAIGQPPGNLEADAMEFIVRTREGQVVSIVQHADATWRPGQPIAIDAGPQARLIAAPP